MKIIQSDHRVLLFRNAIISSVRSQKLKTRFVKYSLSEYLNHFLFIKENKWQILERKKTKFSGLLISFQGILSWLVYHISLYIAQLPTQGFPDDASGKEPTCQCRSQRRLRFDPWVRKIPWRRAWQPPPVFLPGESHGPRSLMGYSPLGHRVRHD